jgi:hypothetical protein
MTQLTAGKVPFLLAVLAHRRETRQRIPDAWRSGILRHRSAFDAVILTIWFFSLCDIVAPAHAGAMQQIGDVRPCEMPIRTLDIDARIRAPDNRRGRFWRRKHRWQIIVELL